MEKILKNNSKALKLLQKMEIHELLDKASKQYYNKGESFLTDTEFDKLAKKYNYKKIGAKDPRAEIKLPVNMGSLTNVNTIKGFPKEVVVTPKLDGMSLLAVYKKGKFYQAITRGDNVYGQDVTDKVKHLMPKKINFKASDSNYLYVKGELLIKLDTFRKKYSKDKGGKYSNARNFVSGSVNRRDGIVQDVDFIAHDIINLNKTDKAVKFGLLKEWGFKVVPYKFMYATDKKLTKRLTYYKDNYKYQVDGIVVEINEWKERNKLGMEGNGRNPKYMKAFKVNALAIETTVNDIEWNISKQRKFIPTVIFDEIDLNGASTTRATAHNYEYIKETNLGIGSSIGIVRSGEVIPYIEEVYSTGKSNIPKICPFCKKKLKVVEVHLMCPNKKCEGANFANIVAFFGLVGVEELSYGRIKQLYDAGYNSIKKILYIKKKQLLEIEGIQKTLAKKLYNNIQVVHEADIALVAHASGIFTNDTTSLGYKRLLTIFQTVKLTDNIEKVEDKLSQIKGIGEKILSVYIDNVKTFKKFLKTTKLDPKNPKKKKTIKGVLSGYVYCFTGVRDKDLENNIINLGGEISDTLTKNVTHLIYADTSTVKYKQAKARGIKCIHYPNTTKIMDKYLYGE